MRIELNTRAFIFDYPDDFPVDEKLWLDLQARLIEDLQEMQDAGVVHSSIYGMNGDPAFRKALDRTFKEYNVGIKR